MGQQPTREHITGRRSAPRLRLGIPAKLVTLSRTQSATLDDLSKTGAQVTLSQPESFEAGVLSWLQFEAFADVVWQDRQSVGLRFDEPITQAAVLETRRAAPGEIRDHLNRERDIAREWVNGAPDW